MFRTTATLLLMILALGATFPAPAWAYLDPGTGSYIIQMVVAGILGGLFAMKVFWVRIRGFLGRVFSRGPRHD